MKKGALLFGSLLLSLLLVEGVLCLIGYDINTHPFWQYDSRLGWVIGDDVHFDQVNSTGFRHRPVEVMKPAETKRLVVLGDSFTLATSLEYSKTFPALLEDQLGENERWEVLTLAVDDWGWSQQLIALENVGLDYSPDVVVSQLFPLNDFCNNCLVMAQTCSMQDYHRPYFVLKENGLRLTSLYPWRKTLRDHSRLAGLIENLVDDPWARARRISRDDPEHPDLSYFFEYNARKNGLCYPDAIQSLLPPEHQQEELADCWRVCEAIMARIVSITSERGIRLLAAVIPFLYTFEEHWPELQKLSSAPVQPRFATDQTEKILADLRVPVVSLRAKIAASGEPPERYFISLTDGHLSEFGHSQLAKWLLEKIRGLELGSEVRDGT